MQMNWDMVLSRYEKHPFSWAKWKRPVYNRRGYRRIYGAVLRLRRRRLDPNVHNDELPLVEHQLVRVEAQRSRPDLAGF
jgi:hypothetical protein